MVCIDLVKRKCVWLMIVVVCVCSLGEEYGCVCVWVSREMMGCWVMLSAVRICMMDFFF